MASAAAKLLRNNLCLEIECTFDEGCGCLDAIDAALAAERERCARVVENYPWPAKTADSMWGLERSMIAAAIREANSPP